LKAVDRHAELLRESAADVGNDHRLGANEAPPAIISVYLGAQLEDVLTQLINTGSATSSIKREKLDTGVRTLPDFAKDATDRNRTAPLAFTGNKFEFRMVGSRDSVAASTIVLNTIVAEAFSEASDVLEKAENFDLAVHDLIKKYAAEHERIVFSGNGYSQEWVEEAARRGLPNIKTMVEAIPHLTTDKTVNLFEKFGVFTKAELQSRAEINYETYAKAVNIEARAMIDIASKHIIPAVIKYITSLATSVNQVREACADVDVSVQAELLAESSKLLVDTRNALKKLVEKADMAATMSHGKAKAEFILYEVVPVMEELRIPVDKLEMIVNKEMWPMPSYGDLLFEV
jgi:glutamine synthetase